MQPNFKRMITLIDEVFETRNDPNQLQVNEAEMEKLQHIHADTLTEIANEEGPTTWVLLIPTTKNLMLDFLQEKINETQLLHLTEVGATYTCIYLCSATTLPEFRGKGQTLNASVQAIHNIQQQHPIHELFVWHFTPEGKALANKIATLTGLTLHSK
jgi:hypothetical protein